MSLSDLDIKNKLEYQKRIAAETKVPKPKKKAKLRMIQKTIEQKNNDIFAHLENL